ncbi:FMN-dependent NADH-azoreductase [Polyangium aurulentum]|uniref:FMN-dependent NADH-azoreductase n=1 Tax=Polyangium aurulentum TaxID=2567896 RepID=UPI0010AE218C|nr:NAD(P)H-dependent oxidoreductase [Polyangium aurulentum]UQA55651.1 NAD(P)H-dependent oxidoreductase [Polyangium aurulentum]
MGIVLDLFAVPRAERSRTRKLRDAFFRSYLQKHPETQKIEVDLARDYDKLPAWDEWDVQTKFEMLYGEGNLDEEQAARWNALSRWTDQLHAANLVVVSTPMWNLSIPWQLKRWIDAVVQGRLTFELHKGEFRGLLTGRPVVLLVTRDGAYPPGSPMESWDHQVPYLRTILGFMGLGPFHEVIAEPLGFGGAKAAQEALDIALAKATELGQSL